MLCFLTPNYCSSCTLRYAANQLTSPPVLCMQPIKIFQGHKGEQLARDFTFIDDVVKGCVASLDTAKPSTGSGGKKTAKAQYRIFNLGNTTPVKVTDFVSILEKLLKKKAIRE